MNAIVYRAYGPPDVLRLEEIERPTAASDGVLIKVHAASVNPFDWHFMRGTPYFLRLMAGLTRPKDTRLGVDVAGQVEAVGEKVTEFKPGDDVFGSTRGAFAEYASTPESAVALKPKNVTFGQAASVPLAGYTALQALRDTGHVQAGQKVLINGAAGGVGTLAVQIAKSFGAEVTGVCSTRNVDMVRAIGADRVVDYTQQDFTKMGQRYDLILDSVGNHSPLEYTRTLFAKGIYVGIGGPDGRWIGPLGGLVRSLAMSPFVSQKLGMVMAVRNKKDLRILADLIETGKIKPVIDRCYALSEVPEAIRYLEQGHARGKVVISVGDPRR